jgi:hypothetical protein
MQCIRAIYSIRIPSGAATRPSIVALQTWSSPCCLANIFCRLRYGILLVHMEIWGWWGKARDPAFGPKFGAKPFRDLTELLPVVAFPRAQTIILLSKTTTNSPPSRRTCSTHKSRQDEARKVRSCSNLFPRRRRALNSPPPTRKAASPPRAPQLGRRTPTKARNDS